MGAFRKINEEQKLEIVRLYIIERFSFRDIAKRLNIGRHIITRILKEQSVEIRPNWCGIVSYSGNKIRLNKKHTINESFFEKIDTPEKAYWLGWMFSDGCVNKHFSSFRLKLKSDDISILQNFKTAMSATQSIVKCSTENQHYLSISGSKMCQDLNRLGCTPNKSLSLKWPIDLKDEYIPLFIRGYFEGDGCIYSCKHNNVVSYAIEIISNLDFILTLQNIIKDKLNIIFYIKNHKNGKTAILHGGKYAHVMEFLSWIYNGYENLRLLRKYDRFQIALN